MSGILAFLAGAGSGYIGQQEKNRQAEREKVQDDQRNQEFQWRAADQARQQDLQRDLKAAGQPIAMTAGANGFVRPDTMDNRDVGLPDTQPQAGQPGPANGGLMPVAYRVGAQGFADQGAAQAEVDKQNTPAGQSGRFIAALQANGRPLEALQLKSATGQAALQDQQVADQQHRSKLGQAMLGGHEALAKFASAAEYGPMAGKSLQAITSPDGKSVTYAVVGADGSVSPRPALTFTNDADGVTKAGYMLDSAITPEHRMEGWRKDTKLGNEQARLANDKAAKAEAARHNAAIEGTEATKANAAMTAANSKVTDAGKPPPGYRRTANGNMEAVPGGPADTKLQGAFNADTAALTGSISSFDRLAASANEVLKHPGLKSTTGMMGALPNVPGSDASNAKALLDTLKSQVGFGVLQDMRNNSKTGGALGSVSDAEGKRLEANLAALDKAQSYDQFKAQLEKIIDYTNGAKDRMREAYNLRHPNGQATPPARAPVAPPPGVPQARSAADLDKLPAGSLFVGPDGVTRRKP